MIRYEDLAQFKTMLIERVMKIDRLNVQQAISKLSKNKEYGFLFKGMLPEEQKEEKRLKHGNEICWDDGFCFRSRKEAGYYQELKMLLAAGEIAGFCLQPCFILEEGTDKDSRAITYKADFIVFHNGKIKPTDTYEIVDTKGFETEQFKRTLKMFKAKYPRLELKVVK